MKQTRVIPCHILVSLRVRGNLAYLSAQCVNRSLKGTNERVVYKEVFAARVEAFLRVINDGAKFEIEKITKGIK